MSGFKKFWKRKRNNGTKNEEKISYMNENQDIISNYVHKQMESKMNDSNGTPYIKNGIYKVFNGKYHTLRRSKGILQWNNDSNDLIIPNENKVILFIGETGAGKSSTLNTIQNYLENIKYMDNFRWKLVKECKQRALNQAESQTKHLTIYHSHNYTFIDTPGFNDTDGKEQDNETIDDIKILLDSTLDYIDAVCFVIKNGDNRMTASMRYVIDTVLGLFAKDILNNIFIMVTHSDTKKIPPIVSNHETLKLIHQQKRVVWVNNEPYSKPSPCMNGI